MPTQRRGRQAGVATLAAGVVVGVLATLAAPTGAIAVAEPEPTPATTAPVDTPDIDPVLDAVPVEATPTIRDADERLAEAAGRQNETFLRLIQAQQRQLAFAGKAGTAGEVAAEAQRAADRARADVAAQERELAERQAVERARRAVLAERQAELRGLAARLLTVGTDDDLAILLGTVDDIGAATRREALRDRGTALQVARVDEAHGPWAHARGARRAQERRLGRAQARSEEADAEALRTADERDRFGELLAAAQGAVRTAQADFDDARDASRDVLIERRTARLDSIVEDEDLPLVALDAYWRASQLAPCWIPWWVIAGVGRVESRHGSAQGSTLTPEGDTTVHILGIPLDGRPGTIAIADTDGGRLDDDTAWDRAVGPMQFIPGTWGRWAADGNADEEADPHNLYDAALAAARYLCFSRGDLLTEAQIRAALLAYNRSGPYGTKVLSEGRSYFDALDLPESPRPRPEPLSGD